MYTSLKINGEWTGMTEVLTTQEKSTKPKKKQRHLFWGFFKSMEVWYFSLSPVLGSL